ncbi:MAG: hypothetical protein WAL25_15700, partial [Acidimicrobiia bacterium]
LTGAISFRRDLGDRDEVAVKNDDWKVLSEIGTGSSISQIADQLGTTEFWTARVAARLIKSDLVDLRESHGQDEYAPVEETTWASVDVEPETPDPVDDYTEPTERDYEPSTEPTSYDEPAEVFASDDEPEDEEPHAGSWWQEPVAEDEEPEDEEPRAPEVVAEGLSEMPSVEAAADDETADGQDVEEDTEAFLEKVFSELDSNESESEEGHGLLRRRRMGTLRDFSSDS